MTLTDADFAYLRTLAAAQSGVQLDERRRYAVDSRVGDLVRALPDVESPTALVSTLRRGPVGALHMDVVEALTTNETSFFRDSHPFEALGKGILPSLVEARRHERTLSVWSAACSTGQEPYSVAMLLRDTPACAGWNVRIVASDISRNVLDRARAGCYSDFEVGRGLDATRRARWFARDGASWQVNDDLRRSVDFRQVNLTGRWPSLPPFDVVLLRNVLIYFDTATKRMVLDRVRRALRPDGYLILGSTETLVDIESSWRRERVWTTTWFRPD